MKRILEQSFYSLLCLIFCALASTADAQQFIVRTVYFQPTDAPDPTAEIIDLLIETQDFYRGEMERHGYGPKTFRLETDGQGNPGIHILKGKHPAFHYKGDTYNQLLKELPFEFNRASPIAQNNIHLIIIAGLDHVDNTKLGSGWPFSMLQSGGNAIVPGEIANRRIIAHELGHAFGLFHTGVLEALMSTRGSEFFLDYEARWLSNHHFFNDKHIKTDVPEGFIDLPVEAIGGGTIRFRIIAASKSGLYHCQLCRKRETYILGYDDSISGDSDIVEIDVSRGRLIDGDDVWFQVMDVNGNYTFHHMTHIALPDINKQQPTNKNPDIVLPPDPEPEIEIEVKVEEVIDCPDCMPDGVDNPIDDTDLNVRSVRLLTTQWAALKQR